MEKRMKNRLALLGILLVVGLLMAGMGTAVGAEKVLAKLTQGFGKEVKAVAIGNLVTIYEDGKAIQNFTLPEDAVAVWEFSNGTIRIKGIKTKQEIEKEQAEHESEKNRLLEIAKKDSRVQELIKGKEHRILGVGILSNETAILTLEVEGNLALGVEGQYYKVTIDLNSEAVTSIEELKSEKVGSGIKISYGSGVQ